jgi:hypothetical protein
LDAPHEPKDRGVSVVEKLLHSWLGACEDYRQRERRELIEREPSRAAVEEFRQELKWLLRSAKQLQSLVTDPDFPAPQYAEEIAWRVRQLEDSWRSLNNPVSQAEAEALMMRYFPEDPLVVKLSGNEA